PPRAGGRGPREGPPPPPGGARRAGGKKGPPGGASPVSPQPGGGGGGAGAGPPPRRGAAPRRDAPPPGGRSPPPPRRRRRGAGSSLWSREEAVVPRLQERSRHPIGMLRVDVVVGRREPAGADSRGQAEGSCLGLALLGRPHRVAGVGQEQEEREGQAREPGRRSVLPQGAQELEMVLTGETRLDRAVGP